MGRKSTKANKNIYQTSREALGLTREEASERIGCISADRIEKIESGKVIPHPEDVFEMSRSYGNFSLCNYFCSHECRIGQEYVPEIKIKDLSQITLEMLATLNSLSKAKERLIEITVDGEISEDEQADFADIRSNLEKMAMAISSLELWVNSVSKPADTGK